MLIWFLLEIIGRFCLTCRISLMKLSVIIPSYNRAHVLRRALDSVQTQAWDGSLELILVDDGSTDGTEQLMAKHYPEVRYIYQQNRGVSAARNLGLQAAAGEWLALLDSDDAWLEHKLAQQFAMLEQTGLQVCHTDEIWIRNGVRVNQMNKHKKTGGNIFMNCLPICAMSPSSIVLHRDVIEHVGCFDPALKACEDYDLWLRIASQYEVAYVSQACIRKYGGHEDQLSRQYWGMDRFRVIALEKLLTQADRPLMLSASMRAAARAMLIKKTNILLKGAIKHQNRELIEDCQARLARFEVVS